MILYGSSLSPYVRKVLVMASELGIALQNIPTPPGSEDPAFRAASPFGKIPALEHGDFRLCDSSAIAVYLDALAPEAALIPLAPQERARTIWLEEFADGILFPAGAKLFFNRIVKPLFLKQRGNAEEADQAESEEIPPLLDYLEGIIPASGYLVEGRLTLADIAVASPLVNLLHNGVVMDPARHPRLAQFVGMMFARPAFAELIARERAFLARFMT